MLSIFKAAIFVFNGSGTVGKKEICIKEAVDDQRSKIRKGVWEVGE